MEMFRYSGQTTDELLALEDQVSEGQLVFAFRAALKQKFERAMGQEFSEPLASRTFNEAVSDVAAGRVVRGPLTEEELIVLGIVALEAQVRNGGHEQMFHNCFYFTAMLVKALRRIGRDDVASVTQEAINILNVQGPLTDTDAIFRALHALSMEERERILELDGQFYDLTWPPAEDILDVSLWNFIKKNRDKITVP